MGLVYSTDRGRTCPRCRQALAHCSCRAAAAPPQGDGAVRVSRQTKGRGGKTVTLVHGLPLGQDALARLGKELRTACGSGGTVKDGVVELQGDHAERLLALLEERGWRPRRVGG